MSNSGREIVIEKKDSSTEIMMDDKTLSRNQGGAN